MGKILDLSSQIQKEVDDIKELYSKDEEGSPLRYVTAKNIRKSAQAIKVAAQEIRKTASAEWKSSKK